MATRQTHAEQSKLGTHSVHDFGRGDLLEDTSNGSSPKYILSECPICASDPNKPRYFFDEQESRPNHFAKKHTISDI
jgi:hypothetical protein